jgi:translocation protein SEC63
MLDYDNSAFYYFAITLLCFYLIPGTWYFLSECYQAFSPDTPKEIAARTTLEKGKASQLKKKTKGFARLNNWTFIVNFIFLIFAFALFFYLFSLVAAFGEVSRFDPFQILGLEPGAEAGEIKKAYRKLSLKYHPDKNPGDKIAEEMFMKIAKAYEALTDVAARENFEKYGNPDGKQALEVSIGLPTALLENPKVVLVLYLIGMVVVIPVVVGLWYANSKQYGEKNIKYETYSLFFQLLTEASRIKMMPEVFSSAVECRELFQADLAREEFSKLFGMLKAQKLMHKPKIEHPSFLQTNLLLHAHVLRLNDLTPVK